MREDFGGFSRFLVELVFTLGLKASTEIDVLFASAFNDARGSNGWGLFSRVDSSNLRESDIVHNDAPSSAQNN